LKFNPLTGLPGPAGGKSRVKFQPQWLSATYEALQARKSNLQLQIGADFPFANCPVLKTPQIVNVAAEVWIACKPVVDAMRKRR